MAINGIAINNFHSLIHSESTLSNKANRVSQQFEVLDLQTLVKAQLMAQHFSREDVDNNDELRVLKNNEIIKPVSMSKTAIPLSVESLALGQIQKSQEQPQGGVADDFIRLAWSYAKKAGLLLRLDPKILLAQAALETGWGQYVVKNFDGESSNNLFNIKATSSDRDFVSTQTKEFFNDRAVSIKASFKKYSSIGKSFDDYVNLIKNNLRYEKALANSTVPKRYVEELHLAGYATDPQYSAKILAIYESSRLQLLLNRNNCC
ncbi:MAG: glucosaminidase domain-containing protein [Tatlockia sp.]|nr:glucosaminidase domain-containing protein [Tatlockia sp.]